jgi:predicted kinase
MSKFYNVDDLTSSKKVSVKSLGDLSVLKYSKSVFFNQEFEDERILDCRGTVLNKDGDILSLPFRKIFNHGEKFAPQIDLGQAVIGVHKLNGFMLSLTIVDGLPLWSTTGSLQNEYIEMGKEYLWPKLEHNYLKLERNFTYMFEICYPSDPHIVPETAGAYLIGARLKDNDVYFMKGEEALDLIAKQMGWLRPSWRTGTFGEFLEEMYTNKTEGYIIKQLPTIHQDLLLERPLLKLKTNWYRFCKTLARGDTRSLSKAEVYTRNNKEYDEVLKFVKANKVKFFNLPEQLRLQALRNKELPPIVESIYHGTLVLVRGLPGTGKTTFVRKILDLFPIFPRNPQQPFLLEADQYFYDMETGAYNYDKSKIGEAHKDCQARCEQGLQHGVSVLFVANTFTTEKEMKPYFDLAQKYNYRIVTLIAENRHGNVSVHNVPEDTMNKMKNRFDIKL